MLAELLQMTKKIKIKKSVFLFSPCIPLLSEKHEQIREENDPQKRPIFFIYTVIRLKYHTMK